MPGGPYVASEADVKLFEYMTLEDPAQNIYKVFGPRFQSHRMTQGLDERIAEAGQKRRGCSGSQKKVVRGQGKPRLGIPDRWCARWVTGGETVLSNDLGEERTAFPIEYKAPYKIGVQDFEVEGGLV
ncbi:kinase-like domain [Fusarium albosuccineum]|uniref:Kinase-like domain n=1 Tax=Fusarium albosuccineum TaxID=1237068 RepID=A0A8H4PCJ7_9HYPO|nr:kinase-like domain [Fusarium albosuccineum]